MRTVLTWACLTLLTAAASTAAPPRSAEVMAGAWVEEREGGPWLVVGLYRRAETTGPARVFVGLSVPGEADAPGGYGTIPVGGWTEVLLEAGVLVRAERALRADERDAPPSVLVTTAAATKALEVHPLIVGEVPEGTLHFDRPARETVVQVARHVLEVGQATEITLTAPPASFFHDDTLEVAVASRRLGLDGLEAEGASGYVDLAWVAPQAPPPPLAHEMRGAEGERRLRAHFTDPTCAWAQRHVAWMSERWVIEYAASAPLTFRLGTAAVKRPGVVSDIWRGYGALAVEAIYPNGFGGSSTNFDLPAILVVPRATAVRLVPLAKRR